jgi:hypothetical protein
MTFYYVIKLVGYAEQRPLIPKRLCDCVSNLMLRTYVGERHLSRGADCIGLEIFSTAQVPGSFG